MADERLEVAIKAVNEASKALRDVQKDMGALDDQAKKTSKGFAGLSDNAKKAAAVGIGALVTGLGYAVNKAIEAERVMKQTEAVIKATGGAAGLTADEIANLALAESRLTSIDDEVVQSGMNMLLTFKQIGGETFPRASRAMEDMAVAMAGGDASAVDLTGTAIQLGKALNDPVRGITALTRVGVTFTDAQKDAIKQMVAMNDIAGAQAIILSELESEFGGAAETAGTTLAGKMQKAQNAIDNFAASIGEKLIPVLGDAAEAATTLIEWGERIDAVFTEHLGNMSKQVQSGEISIADFRAEMERAAVAAGKTSFIYDQWGNVIGKQLNPAVREQIELQLTAIGVNDDARDRMGELASATQAAGDASAAFNDAQSNLNSTQALLNEGMKRYSAELLFNKAAANLDEEAALQLGLAMGVVDANTVLAMEKLATLRYQYDSNRDGAISAAEAANGYSSAVIALNERISALSDKTITITYREIIERIMATAGTTPGGGRQHGGPVMGGSPYVVGEAGPELFVPGSSGNVIDNRRFDRMIAILESIAGSTSGGNVTINSGASTDIIEKAVSRSLGRQFRKARTSGKAITGAA